LVGLDLLADASVELSNGLFQIPQVLEMHSG
jgi:hypothetical protein